MRKSQLTLLSILFLFIGGLQSGCYQRPGRVVHRSFYYWRSTFRLQPAETEALRQLQIENLYVKFFDVVWNEESQKAGPAAPLNFSQSPPPAVLITPVIFITNETMQRLEPAQVDSLAKNITHLLSGLIAGKRLRLSPEVQIDCDWTPRTRESYFHLLKAIRNDDFCKNKILSVTIRLHQLKFISENGIPPADKGLLMCYNMGNLRHPETGNSIIDPKELEKYIARLAVYPLALDVALPLFDWWVWFKAVHYKGLIHGENLKSAGMESKKIVFQTDTALNGFTFEKGDWLRYENSPVQSLQQTAMLLRHKLSSKNINVALYHLAADNLSKYKAHELESFFDGFR